MDQRPLITHAEVERELRRLFHGGAGAGLRIRVWGEEGAPGSAVSTDALRELVESLQMHDPGLRDATGLLVAAPGAAVIERALLVLQEEEHQRRLLDLVLTLLGHRLIDPVAAMLETPIEEVRARLYALREGLLGLVQGLGVTRGAERRLQERLREVLADEYLREVGELEEQRHRPVAAQLAQRVLAAIGATFRGLLGRWPEHARRVADKVAERLPQAMNLRALPRELRVAITEELEAFFWATASAELEAELLRLFSDPAYQDVVPDPAPSLQNDAYREIAEMCWQIIAERC